MPKKNLTLYLAKQDVEAMSDILTENARSRLAHESTIVSRDDAFGDGATLYVFVGSTAVPAWLIDLRDSFDIADRITNRSSCAVLAFRMQDRIFAATFAHGWMYLDEEKLEADFGLRVALNALDEKKLKRLERANLAHALRGVDLSPFQREFTEFGIDHALDLVRKVSGSARDQSTADTMSGARSLKVRGEYQVGDLPSIATEAIAFYQSEEYRQTSFSIIDLVSPISDSQTIRELDAMAAQAIREGTESFELSLPISYDDDDVAYRFKGPGLRGSHPDLLLRSYTASLGARLADLSPTSLRSHKIIAIYSNDARPDQASSIHSALVGSLNYSGSRYAINEGEWYRVDQAFRDSIEVDYEQLITGWDEPPPPLVKVIDDVGNGKYQTEESYNAELAEHFGYVLLDKHLVDVPGVQRSGFEVCDLLDIEEKRLIHVKKNSRRSSVLSHFFKQGANSAQNLASVPTVSDQLAVVVEDLHGESARAAFHDANSDVSRKWTIEFWIADAPRASGEFNIPFFSKISLRDEVRRMRAMSYRVALRFIRLDV